MVCRTLFGMRAEAALGHLVVFGFLSACGPESTSVHRGQGGGAAASGASGASGTSGSGGSAGLGGSGGGVRTPDIPIVGVGGRAPGIVVRDSTLKIGPRGWLDWYFTVENQTTEPFCDSLVGAKLYDSAGTLLAGSEVGSYYIDDVTPGFSAALYGAPYRQWRGDGVLFLVSCIPPGERGLGGGSILGRTVPFTADDALALVARAAKIEFTVGYGAATDGLERAEDAIEVDGAALADQTGGKVLRGSVVAGADLSSWTLSAMLFDSSGAPTDLVRSFGSYTTAGARSEFESELGGETAVRFEIALEAQYRH